MTHYEYAIEYLTLRMAESISHVHMWRAVEDGDYEEAMTHQFSFLFYHDAANEMAEKMTGQQTAELVKMFDIAYGVTR